MTAHPRFDANTGRLCCYSYTPNPLSGTALRLWEFGPECQLARPVQEYSIPGIFGLFHDFVITKNYAVFTASPQGLGNLGSAGLDILLGRKSPGESIEFDDSKPTNFVVFRRDGGDGGKPIVIPVDTHFNFHYANAFEVHPLPLEAPGCRLRRAAKPRNRRHL